MWETHVHWAWHHLTATVGYTYTYTVGAQTPNSFGIIARVSSYVSRVREELYLGWTITQTKLLISRFKPAHLGCEFMYLPVVNLHRNDWVILGFSWLLAVTSIVPLWWHFDNMQTEKNYLFLHSRSRSQLTWNHPSASSKSDNPGCCAKLSSAPTTRRFTTPTWFPTHNHRLYCKTEWPQRKEKNVG